MHKKQHAANKDIRNPCKMGVSETCPVIGDYILTKGEKVRKYGGNPLKQRVWEVFLERKKTAKIRKKQ